MYLVQSRRTKDDEVSKQLFGPVLTDGQGTASFTGIPQFESYALAAYGRLPNKFVGVAIEHHGLPHGKSDSRPFEIIMVPAVLVSGKVSVPPGVDPAGVTVRVMTYDVQDGKDHYGSGGIIGDLELLPWAYKTNVSRDGRYTLHDLPRDGMIYLAAEGPRLGQAQAMSDQPGAAALDMRMAPEGVIEGIVRDKDGQSAAGIKVAAQPHRGANGLGVSLPYESVSDAQGRFLIGGLPALKYNILAGPGPERPDVIVNPVTNLTVDAGQKVKDLELRMEPGVIVQGMVRDSATSAPLKGAKIRALGKGEDEADLGYGTTDEQGVWRIRVPAGPVTLYVFDPAAGYTFPRNPDGSRISDYFNKDIVVSAGEGIRAGLDFILDRVSPADQVKYTRARGRVLDAQGKPLADAIVREDVKYPDGRQEARIQLGRTGPDGTYEVKVQVGAEYKLFVEDGSQGVAWSKPFIARENEVNQVEDFAPPATTNVIGGRVQNLE